jgi:hypothetical protein
LGGRRVDVQFGRETCMKTYKARHLNVHTCMAMCTRARARLKSGAWPGQHPARLAEETQPGVPIYSAILSARRREGGRPPTPHCLTEYSANNATARAVHPT